MINVFQPSLGEEEVEAVRQVFASNWVGKGKITSQFEAAFAHHLDAEPPQLRSISCCTEGLFQSMALLGIGEGDEVVIPSVQFVGVANAVVECGATPIFCDVDPRTLNTTAEHLEPALSSKTKAAFILHYGGVPAPMDEICDLLDGRGIALIEDSACSVASRYKGRACGTFGDVAIWSFDAMKILVCADGGMVYCKSPEMATQAEERIYLGLTGKSGFANNAHNRWWEFDVSCSGRRAIMNDMSSAIGLEQLKKLPGFIARRRQVSDAYDLQLGQLDWLQTPPALEDGSESSYYFYHVQAEASARDRLAKYLRDAGIYTTFRYYPLHMVPFYGWKDPLPNAELAAATTLCLPIHQSLSDDDVSRVVEVIHEFGKGL